MHIVFFLDYHPETLGGAQLSANLQIEYLRKRGHLVTICTPASALHAPRKDQIITPSFRVTPNGEYQMTIPTKRLLRRIDESFAKLPPIDIVHIQADFWGAILGTAFVKRHKLPSVITYHTNVQIGVWRALGPIAAPILIGIMSTWLRRYSGRKYIGSMMNGWDYVAALGDRVDLRQSPTAHFGRALKDHGMRGKVEVVSNGLDDAALKKITPHKHGVVTRPKIIWIGRMSKEKRLMEFLEAVKFSGVDADVSLYGTGTDMQKARRFVRRNKLSHVVTFHGAVPSTAMLKAIAASDVLVQTSIGFETQGRTVIEAFVLGVPVILTDPNIAEDFDKSSYWLLKDTEIETLADMLRTVVQKIKSGTSKYPDHEKERQRFLQSAITKRQEALYHEIISRKTVV